MLHLVEGLARHADVVLASFGDGPPLGLDAVRAEQPKRGLSATLLENLRTPRPSLPLQVRVFLDSGMRSTVQRELAGWRPDVVHATLARTAPGTLADGSFVDPAMTGAAALTVALANRYGVSRRIGA